jgi:regulator of sirC expression with transglutaminase-like and TPR domain
LELQAEGISFPGHFLVKVTLPEGLVVLDPLTGDSLGLDNLAERLAPFRQHLGDASDMEAPLGLYLQPAPPRDILTRMLRNLKEIFNSQEDWQRLIKVQDRLLVLHPDALAEKRDRGLALIELGQNKAARDDLLQYVLAQPDASDVPEIQRRLASLQI